jgi:scyllo-inositol 2-dehydrogenase (NADP+)
MPKAVTADAFIQRPEAHAVDYFHLILDYGRSRAILHGAVLVPGRGPHFSVQGDRASFLKYGMDPQEEALVAGGMQNADDPANYGVLIAGDGEKRTIETIDGDYRLYYEGIADAIEYRAPVPVDPADSRNGLAVIEAAIESARERRTVELKSCDILS